MEYKSLILNNNENEIIDVENIYKDIKEKILTARSKMLKHIDTTMTEVYWYVGKLTHQDIGQMQMYVNYYRKTQMI